MHYAFERLRRRIIAFRSNGESEHSQRENVCSRFQRSSLRLARCVCHPLPSARQTFFRPRVRTVYATRRFAKDKTKQKGNHLPLFCPLRSLETLFRLFASCSARKREDGTENEEEQKAESKERKTNDSSFERFSSATNKNNNNNHFLLLILPFRAKKESRKLFVIRSQFFSKTFRFLRLMPGPLSVAEKRERRSFITSGTSLRFLAFPARRDE